MFLAVVVLVALAVFVEYGDELENYIPSFDDDRSQTSENVSALTNYAVSISSSAGGTASGEGVYKSGSRVALHASPDDDHDFAGWYESGKRISTDPDLRFLCSDDKTLIAIFDKLLYDGDTVTDYYSAGVNSGTGTYSDGDHAILSTTVNPGYVFDGWYANGILISDDLNTSYDVMDETVIEVRYSIDHDASFTVSKTKTGTSSTLTLTSEYNVEVSGRTWRMVDLMTGAVLSEMSFFGNSGNILTYNCDNGKALAITQTVTYTDGYKTSYTDTAVINETLSVNYDWKYQESTWYSPATEWIINNKTANRNISISFDDYYKYHTMKRSNSYSRIGDYMTVDDPTIQKLVKDLVSLTSGMSDLERVNCVLKFVQSIPYIYDIDNKGVNEYWNFPLETLREKKGDCDDHAILFAALVKSMGYNTAIFQLPEHMAVGVDVPGASGISAEKDGITYFYCEATALVGGSWANSANVGYMPSEYSVIDKIYAV
ncbi:MAG: hypothetical protein LBM39_03640 [Candidatus Methanoplasma sp.]|nr:hypothetical protein [Candidatus Methanoplasma sp.]